DVVAPPQASGRNGAEQPRTLRLVERIGHRRLDETGRDAVDGDAPRRDLGRERLRHPDHARLGRGVVRLPGIAGDTDDGRDADDTAPAALRHAAKAGARQTKAGGEVDVEDLLPVLVLHPQRQRVAGQPRIVYEDV